VLAQLMTHDLKPAQGLGGVKFGEGASADRRVSVADREMRYGRKKVEALQGPTTIPTLFAM
jgi:hypothetical protein